MTAVKLMACLGRIYGFEVRTKDEDILRRCIRLAVEEIRSEEQKCRVTVTR
jgi:hypothetical protein